MAIKMVREPSETPNINNIDDIIPMRYAYGNQNGYVIGKGTEVSNTINGTNFVVNSGRLVLQGVECDIDAGGFTITIDNISTKRYYVVFLQVNLATNKVTIENTYDTAAYPIIDLGDDLTENSSGIARMILYKFTTTNGIIAEVNKVVESVKYVKDVYVENSKRVNGIEFTQNDEDLIKVNDFIIQKELLIYKNTNPTFQKKQTINFQNVSLKKGDTFKIKHSAQNGYGFHSDEFLITDNISSTNYELFNLTSTRVFGSDNTTSNKTVYNYSADMEVYSDKIVVGWCICTAITIPSSGNITTSFQSIQNVGIHSIYQIIE